MRAQYSYKGRYMVSASIRGDGSSRFAPNTRWGYFPAASVGWQRVSDESFLRDVKWIDDLAASQRRRDGHAQIGNSEYLQLYGSTNIDLATGSDRRSIPRRSPIPI